ncbi:DUF7937 domain-containing protein [Phytoactinopolyspora halotolerans]|uniref:Uncharacterized protein n=1 Tax=Phytoactinopolyspora halotolerans TaxID=1981512 RepID=A0A6L9S499_9ACTN|nr:hypothetical protein [Phytoactinopolyspora halotolerans]NED99898.1 hypothetical protein [Phytoactinopolyspora halotolerans]
MTTQPAGGQPPTGPAAAGPGGGQPESPQPGPGPQGPAQQPPAQQPVGPQPGTAPAQPAPGQPVPGQPGAMAPGAAQQYPGAYGGQPAAARPNPFASIPVFDYVRDALALLLLLIPLGMAWDFEDNATGKVYVILVTLLSVVSLSLPYLRAVNVLPPTLGAAQLRLVRLLANAPYLIVVLLTLVLGYLGDTTLRGTDVGDGVGVGVVIGLAGALLAAQARASEQDASTTDGMLWRSITLGLAGLGVLCGIVSAVIFLIDFGDVYEWSEIVVLLLSVVFFVGVPALAAAGLLRGQAAWRDVAIVLGVVGLMMSFWALGADETIGESWWLRFQGPEFLFWPAIGVAAAAPSVAALIRPEAGARRWIGMALRLLETGVVIAVLSIALYAFTLIENEDARGAYITVLVFSLFALAAFLVARQALTADARAGRPVAVGVAGALVIIGIVMATVLGSSDAAQVAVGSATVISAYFVFAVALVIALTVPKSVRDELGAFSFGQASLNGGAGQQTMAGGPGVAQPGGPGYPAGGPAAGAPGPYGPASSGGAAPAQAWPQAGTQQPAAGEERPRTSSVDETAGAAAQAEQATGAPHDAVEPASAEVEEDSTATQAESGEQPGRDESDQAEAADAQPGMRTEDRPTQVFAATTGEPGTEPETGAGPEQTDGESETQVLPSTAQSPSTTGDQATEVLGTGTPAQVPEAPQPEGTASGFTAEMASDPNTPLQTLADIAQKEPALRPLVALNPSAYPGLLEWLAQLGDPAVDHALRRRQQ